MLYPHVFGLVNNWEIRELHSCCLSCFISEQLEFHWFAFQYSEGLCADGHYEIIYSEGNLRTVSISNVSVKNGHIGKN